MTHQKKSSEIDPSTYSCLPHRPLKKRPLSSNWPLPNVKLIGLIVLLLQKTILAIMKMEAAKNCAFPSPITPHLSALWQNVGAHMASNSTGTEKHALPTLLPNLRSKLVPILGTLHATIRDAFPKLGFVMAMMTALTIPTRIKIAPPPPVQALTSDVPLVDVFLIRLGVMETMIVEMVLVSWFFTHLGFG